MKNIHILPTDKPTKLHNKNGGLETAAVELYIEDFKGNKHNSFHIYITSNEEPYPYALHLEKQEVLKVRGVGENSEEIHHDKGFSYKDECSKIILTTDQELIKDGVQAIDDEFLEWFVKNPSCESVEVEDWYSRFLSCCRSKEECYCNKKRIIIPKEEPKQETLEEAAEKLYPENWESIMEGQHDSNSYERNAFIKGAKWQAERMYSEKEVLDILNKLHKSPHALMDIGLEKWFEQFKKK